MPFRFKKATCVVIGRFNMYIVQPSWLAKIGVIPKGIPVAIGTKLDEPGFRFSSLKLPHRWYVTPNRIEVETEDPEADCGGAVGAVLEKLPWTPLSALGNNAIYEANTGELEELPDLGRFSPHAPEGYELAQRTFHFGVKREDHLYNLQLSVYEETIELSTNAHTDLSGKESEDAQQAARRFLADRQEAEKLIKEIFKARIEHGDGNSAPA